MLSWAAHKAAQLAAEKAVKMADALRDSHAQTNAPPHDSRYDSHGTGYQFNTVRPPSHLWQLPQTVARGPTRLTPPFTRQGGEATFRSRFLEAQRPEARQCFETLYRLHDARQRIEQEFHMQAAQAPQDAQYRYRQLCGARWSERTMQQLRGLAWPLADLAHHRSFT
jgi:hypothetical protein